MSDLQSKQAAAELLRDALNSKPSPHRYHLLFGVLYPATVIAIELATRWCAQTFFDPMPTVWYTLAVLIVPSGNLLVWLALRNHIAVPASRLALVNGMSMGIAAFYALIFLPLLPLSIVAVLVYGLGLLPMGPLASLISASRLAIDLKTKYPARTFGKRIAAGFAIGLVLLVGLDIPAAATRLGIVWAASNDAVERQRGLALLSSMGDNDLLLRLCYDTAGRPSGPLSALVTFGGPRLLGAEKDVRDVSSSTVREIYYRVMGEAFNARPAPFAGGQWARLDDFQWDNDHGGADVGGRIKGLELATSRIDGIIHADDAVSYLEWIVEFRNTSLLDREARVQFALPPGGVVSRATLWVNGEEKEAAYAGRGEARAAYERVAVQQRRDPLLVTTKGADRVLAQAFPVPRNGGTIKFKIGITAPLELENGAKASLALPAIVDRNFSISSKTPHLVWIESKTPLAMSDGIVPSRTGDENYRVQAVVNDAVLARTRPKITLERAPDGVQASSRVGFGAEIVQEVAILAPKPPPTLMIVVDGSVRVGGAAKYIGDALNGIPEGANVGVMIASDSIRKLAISPWSTEQRRKAQDLITSAVYRGGQDNTDALAVALVALEPHEAAALLWIHGPQPVSFAATAGLLEQASARLSRKAQIWLYATEPGPNAALPDLPIGWSARSIPATGPVDKDVQAFLKRMFDTTPRPEIVRSAKKPALASEVASASSMASEHIARLWAKDEILALASAGVETHRNAAIGLAAEYRLVTPVSGAVVLESRQQYAEAGLTPVSQSSVPTVPEPHEWALILMATISLLTVVWRQRVEARAT